MREWLKKMRTQKSMTMKKVASSAGISECFYSQIESGKRNPTVDVAKSIAKTLGFSWERFYEDENVSGGGRNGKNDRKKKNA